MKIGFDALVTHQPSKVHKVKMSNMMGFPKDELSILISPIDFIIQMHLIMWSSTRLLTP